MFDINGGEFIILLVVAVLVIGPERLPKYAEQLAQLVKRAKVFLQETKSRVDDELGEDIKDVDWAALDPRKYDPRRIVRDALLDDVMPAVTGFKRATTFGATGAAAGTAAAAASAAPSSPSSESERATAGHAPYDDEAT
ncbi:MAG TPA: Sec-independent protein translocase TatB [Cellulomonas sp.]|uniref:Sec-independent protein translocase TatB n=1 Tax=Cellulomonas sp. TaxID=40001 RepID=UPI002E31A580|nr:Sec-independent protein translocase TatB [Cellulomonas sp.]HEX5331669.1 Sec-independent protein translocase TatB [Cellulomonas sp.]